MNISSLQKGLVLDMPLDEESEKVGSEIVTNGNFDTDTAGWVSNTATLAVVNNELQITSTGTYGWAQYYLTTVEGKKYRLTFDYWNTVGDEAAYSVFDNTNSQWILLNTVLDDTQTSTKHSVDFTAGSISTRLILQADNNTDITYFDNVSIRELHTADKTPYSNHGTPYGTAYTTDRMGQADRAMSFNGSSDLVRIPDSPSLSPTVEMSAMIWVNGAAQAGKGILTNFDVGTAQRAYIFFSTNLSPHDKFRVYISNNGTGNTGHRKDYNSSIVVLDNTWHLIGFTFNAGILKLYADRVEDTNPTKTQDDAITTIHNSTADIMVGCYLSSDAPSGLFTGDLARPRMWNRSLTATEWALAFDQYRPKVVI